MSARGRPHDLPQEAHRSRPAAGGDQQGGGAGEVDTARASVYSASVVGAREPWRRVADGFCQPFPRLAQLMGEAEADVLAYLAFPPKHWRQLWSNNPLERLNREIKRRTTWRRISPPKRASAVLF